jgi:hypothetical protein
MSLGARDPSPQTGDDGGASLFLRLVDATPAPPQVRKPWESISEERMRCGSVCEAPAVGGNHCAMMWRSNNGVGF